MGAAGRVWMVVAGIAVVALGIGSAFLGLVIGGIIGIGIGVLALVRVIQVMMSPRDPHKRGPGQSDPGDPGYEGRVTVGDEGAAEEGGRRAS